MLFAGSSGSAGEARLFGHSGWHNQPQVPAICLCIAFFPFFGLSLRKGDWDPGRGPRRSQMRLRPHQRPVLSGCSGATASARPSQEKVTLCASSLREKERSVNGLRKPFFTTTLHVLGQICACVRRPGELCFVWFFFKV